MTEASTVSKTKGDEGAVARTRTGSPGMQGGLVTPMGTTSIESGVVAKVAGMAAREIPGLRHGRQHRTRVRHGPRHGGRPAELMQGVSVEVGERQAAADLQLVVDYGVAIPDVATAVRRNVITAVERMCGLEVTEVNIKVADVHMPGQDGDGDRSGDQLESGPRVQ